MVNRIAHALGFANGEIYWQVDFRRPGCLMLDCRLWFRVMTPEQSAI